MTNKHLNNARYEYLVKRYLTNTCTREELEEFLLLMQDDRLEKKLLSMFQAYWEESKAKEPSAASAASAEPTREADWDAIFHSMMQQAGQMTDGPSPEFRETRLRQRRLSRKILKRGLITAIIIILATGGVYLWVQRPPAPYVTGPASTLPLAGKDVLPGGNKAVLTLADGASISLDSAHDGILTEQGRAKVVKLKNGQLAYHTERPGTVNAPPLYNTVSTPRGGQYAVTLPDGTKVWLNASSSLRFPTAFTGNTRNVELTGEAYFEVAENHSAPFKVAIFSGARGSGETPKLVEVLGTSFNVMAYDDEDAVKTTLLEGAIKVLSGAKESVLKPGQQAQSPHDLPGIRVICDADVEAAVAWKNGYFNFKKADIRTVMRQLSRWYDVDVRYQGNGQDRIFWGGMQRNLPLSAVFRILEKSGVEFKIEGRTVTVNM